MRFGVTTDYDYSQDHKRQKLQVWSGPFMHTYEGDAYSLPSGEGFMVTTYNGDKIRVSCPSPRDETNYERVDRAIDAALNRHYLVDRARRMAKQTPEQWRVLTLRTRAAWMVAVRLLEEEIGVQV